MKIKINRIPIILPLSFFPTLFRLIEKEESEKIPDAVKQIPQVLRDYRKKNGHFTLIDVEDKDGNKVVITI